MIIDAHYHLEPRMESVERLLAEMDRHSIDKVALIPAMVDPFHLGPFLHRMNAGVRKLLVGRGNAVGRALYRSTVTRSGHVSLFGRKLEVYARPDNAPVRELIRQHPGRFVGWFFINPAAADPLPALEAMAAEDAWIGVKAHPFWHNYPVADLEAAAAWCVDHGLPMLVHLGGNQRNGGFRFLPERFPDLKLVYAHAGVPWYRRLWDVLHDADNVSVDLSSPYLDAPLRRAAVEALGPTRCLYGSDGPFGYREPGGGGYDHGAILSELHELPLPSTDIDRILAGNFQRLTNA